MRKKKSVISSVTSRRKVLYSDSGAICCSKSAGCVHTDASGQSVIYQNALNQDPISIQKVVLIKKN